MTRTLTGCLASALPALAPARGPVQFACDLERSATDCGFYEQSKWPSGEDGFMVAWINGRKVLSHRGPTLYRGIRCYLKLANYHSPTGPSSIIHDRVLRGRTAAAVALTPLEGE